MRVVLADRHCCIVEHIAVDDATHTRWWYVVTVGTHVGIWRAWLEMEEYVDVKGCRYQSYDSYAEAFQQYELAKQAGRVRQLLGPK